MTRYRTVAEQLSPLLFRRFPRRFGRYEMLALGSIEWMRRHLAIVNELERLRATTNAKHLTVLDFGGADGSLGRSLRLYGLAHRYRITLVDIDAAALAQPMVSPTVSSTLIDPEGFLPFEGGSFDVVVSSDVFEHIPRGTRSHWADELSRVARLRQIHSFPADSDDGRWISSLVDAEFQAWHERHFGVPERWTAEHLENGVPHIDEMLRAFSGATAIGIVNAQVWLHNMKAQNGPKSPIDRLRYVLVYNRHWRKLESRPPFKNALLVVPAKRAS